MKKSIIILGSILIIFFGACSKSSNKNQYLQPHDTNIMMDTMHAVMNRMETMTMSNDPEIDFAKMMTMHHEGAISMANMELKAGKNDSLKRIAQKIIT